MWSHWLLTSNFSSSNSKDKWNWTAGRRKRTYFSELQNYWREVHIISEIWYFKRVFMRHCCMKQEVGGPHQILEMFRTFQEMPTPACYVSSLVPWVGFLWSLLKSGSLGFYTFYHSCLFLFGGDIVKGGWQPFSNVYCFLTLFDLRSATGNKQWPDRTVFEGFIKNAWLISSTVGVVDPSFVANL